LIQIAIFTLTIFMFVSCGSGGDQKWGIDYDQNQSQKLPVCNGNQKTTTNAKKIKNGTKISKTIDKTVLRIWHYPNGDKFVCVVQGEAVIVDE